MTREEQIKEAARQRADQYDHPSKWSDTYYGFIDGAEWADSHPQWVPVEENQLPPKIEGEEITEYYWVAGLYGRWYDVLRYDYRDGRWSDHYGNYYACVTHWMPIVPPRKEE